MALGGFSRHRTGRTHHRSSTTIGHKPVAEKAGHTVKFNHQSMGEKTEHIVEVQPPPTPPLNFFLTGFF